MSEPGCEEFWRMAAGYLPGLPADPILSAHLNVCKRCREEYQKIQQIMVALKAEYEFQDDSCWQTLRDEVKERVMPAGWRSGFMGYFEVAVGMVTVVLLLLASVAVLDLTGYIQPEEYLSLIPGDDISMVENATVDYDPDLLTGMVGWSSVLMDLYDDV